MTNNAKLLLDKITLWPMWENDAIETLFPKPKYTPETQAEHWQYEANAYGNELTRPVKGDFITFKMNIARSLWDQTYEAIKELKELGLIVAKNNGFNAYSYHLNS